MAVKVDIRADVSQLKEAINQAQGDITQLKVNGSTVTIGGKKIKAEVKEVTNEVKKLNKEVQKTNASTQQGAVQTIKSLKGIGEYTKRATGFIKGVAQSLITPWTFLIIAVEAAIKTFKYFFNNLNESIAKTTARGQSAIKAAQREIKKTEQRTRAVDDLIKKLDELNKLQGLSDDQKSYGAALIRRLNKEYKIFGITLDETTEKYQGLYQAKVKADAAARAKQSEELRKQIQAQRLLANTALKDIFGKGIEIGKPINGSDLFTFAERYNQTPGSKMSGTLERMWGNGKDLYAINTVLDKLLNGKLSTRQNVADIQKAIDAVNSLIDYTQKLDDLNSISRAAAESAERLSTSFDDQRKAIKAAREEVEKLNAQYQKSQKQAQFDALAPKDQIEALKEEVKALEDRNVALEKAKKQSEQLNAQKSTEATNSRKSKQAKQAEQQDLEKEIEVRKAANAQLNKDIDAHYEKFGKQRQKWQSEFDFLDRKIKNAEAYDSKSYKPSEKQYARRAELAGYLAQVDNPVNEMRATIDANKKAIAEAEAKIKQLASQITDAETQAKALGDQALNAEQSSLSAEAQRIQNLTDIAQKKKQIAEIQRKIAEEEAKAAAEAEKAAQAEAEANRRMMQQQMNAEGTLFGVAEKAQIEMLKAQGKKAEADAKERESIVRSLTKQIEGQLGRPLGEKDQAFRDSIEAAADIQMALKGINPTTNRPQIQSDQVYSNELARMGGFSSSIVVDRMDINKEILNVNKQANNNLNTIANSVQKIYDNTTL